MKKILAVSGGIDSVVMLFLFRDDPDVIVAHFDHGIRPNSSEDAAFVQKLANQYGKTFEYCRANLGENCSEENARNARYGFLYQLAQKYQGEIYTAHHRDDIVETIAINIIRGTGWRGLTPLANEKINRPLLQYSKTDIYRIASENNLHFRADQTNTDSKYLRNRVRKYFIAHPEIKEEVLRIYDRQASLLPEIEMIIDGILGSEKQLKKALILDCSEEVATELLRKYLLDYNIRLTRPQLQDAVKQIRTLENGKKISLNKNSFLQVGRYYCQLV